MSKLKKSSFILNRQTSIIIYMIIMFISAIIIEKISQFTF